MIDPVEALDALLEELSALPYQELRRRLKEAGLHARGPRDELIQRLVEHTSGAGQEQEQGEG